MSQVGTIKGYHDGATYSLANIYDEKLVEYNILAGTTEREILSVSFDSTVGIVANVDSDIVTQSNIMFYNNSTSTAVATTANTNRPAANIIPYLSTEHAASGYALDLNYSSSNKQFLKIVLNSSKFNMVSMIKDSSNAYILQNLPSYAFEGCFFVDTSESAEVAFNSYKHLWFFHMLHKNSASASYSRELPFAGHYAYTADTAKIYPTYYSDHIDQFTYVRELDRSVFERPFKYRLEYFSQADNPQYSYIGYVNDQLYFYRPHYSVSQYVHCYFEPFYIGVKIVNSSGQPSLNTGYPIRLSLTNFKFSLLSPVYQKVSVPANMLIRHNNANYYVPLTTNKTNTSTPCLAVRHGNTNYYAIK